MLHEVLHPHHTYMQMTQMNSSVGYTHTHTSIIYIFSENIKLGGHMR